MRQYFTLAASFKAFVPAGIFRTLLLCLIGAVALGEVIALVQSSGADLYYNLCALLLLVGLALTTYTCKTYAVYFFCAGILLIRIHLPEAFSVFQLALLFGIPLAVLAASFYQLLLLALFSFLLFFGGFGEQTFLSWLLSSTGLYAMFFLLPLALRLVWEQKQATDRKHATYKKEVAEANLALARELHDTVARHISLIGLTSDRALLTDSTSGKDAALRTINENTHKALADMRLLIRTTRGDGDPTTLPQTSSATVNLRNTLDEARTALTSRGFALHENIKITVNDVPESLRPTINSLIQEVRFNAEKYAAPGCTIKVAATLNLTGVTITTSNPVAPVSKHERRSRGTGYGLVGINERITRLGGTMRYGVNNGVWSLTIHLPFIA
ncbi:MAG: histidine kinase [Rothia sp. (in: high G+C Gram-positive bacteria)]|nr:histidine kinase [Rothia sp. (in: high G+C Gram-positive bacteria)]